MPGKFAPPNASEDIHRLKALIDGVYAITLTLLVLDLKLPEIAEASLAGGLVELLPRLFIYLIAFYSIANYWIVQQHALRNVIKANLSMMWMLILGLLFITLMPASTAIFGKYPDQPLAIAIFSADNFLFALSSWIFWSYLTRNRKTFASRSQPQVLTINAQVWMFISLSWLLAVLFLLVNPMLTYISWVLLPNLIALWAGRQRKRLLAK